MRKWSKETREQFRPDILKLREQGLTYAAIGERLGCSREMCRLYAMTPQRYERELIRYRNNRAAAREQYKGARSFRDDAGSERSILHDVLARMREIPADTRDLTARLLGDPIPGRRALDKLPPRRLRALGVDAEAQ